MLGYRGPFILDGKMPEVPLADVTLQQKDMMLALNLGRRLGSPVPLAAAANEMMKPAAGSASTPTISWSRTASTASLEVRNDIAG